MTGARRHVGSTYRLQLNGLGFAAAADLVPFLADLGVETCYVSPVSRATAGSRHGYDVADPTVFDPDLGSPEDVERLLAALADHGMGLLVDIVPNHMAASTQNPYFHDVLRRGRESRFAAYFDIAWDEQDGKVLLPVLGQPLDDALAAGELRIGMDAAGDTLVVEYFDAHFPVAPDATTSSAQLIEDCDPGTTEGRRRLGELLAAQHYRLADWRVANHEINYRRFFDINELIGIRQEDPEVFAATHRLTASLAADPRVVGLRVDHVDGLRDPGGYLHQLRQLTEAAASVAEDAEHTAAGAPAAAPVVVVEKILAWAEPMPHWPVEGTTGYEVADLLVGLFVDGPGAAAIAQATRDASGDPRTFGERAAEAKRAAISTLFPHQLDQVVAHVLAALSSEAGVGAGADGRAEASAENDGEAGAEDDVRTALAELTVHLPVYRTYRGADLSARPEDLEVLATAAEQARIGLTASAVAALDAVVALISQAVLTEPGMAEDAEAVGDGAPVGDPAALAVGAWQQLTGPVAAKGVEDTALYDPGALLALADVGADPDRVAVSVAELHEAMGRRAVNAPLALSSTSTHDSKRSHDVRCRLAVLSEIPDAWEKTVGEIEALAGFIGSDAAPDAADRRYLYQTLIGAWPVAGLTDDTAAQFVERIREHLTKAVREGKRHGGWLAPDETYEAALSALAERMLTGDLPEGRELVEATVAEVEHAAATSSLASVVLKTMVPGVPDTYQGDDAWFLALVDPDNRGKLDAAAHRALLAGLPEAHAADAGHGAGARELVESWRTGALKQYVLRSCLTTRRADPELFALGGYRPLPAEGEAAEHVVAFGREHAGRWVLVAVPRLVHGLVGAGRFPLGRAAWGDTGVVVPPGAPVSLTDVLTGTTYRVGVDGQLKLGDLLAELPVAVLAGAESAV